MSPLEISPTTTAKMPVPIPPVRGSPAVSVAGLGVAATATIGTGVVAGRVGLAAGLVTVAAVVAADVALATAVVAAVGVVPAVPAVAVVPAVPAVAVVPGVVAAGEPVEAPAAVGDVPAADVAAAVPVTGAVGVVVCAPAIVAPVSSAVTIPRSTIARPRTDLILVWSFTLPLRSVRSTCRARQGVSPIGLSVSAYPHAVEST
jgi:hypothetical protein